MKPYFAYVRVSTVRQGEHGSSLQEQRDAITHFAARNGLHIASWFEERETAAKVGRREFSRMVAALKKGMASGVIFHKIDRSARNLKDWSDVQDLADFGIDVRFTQESINLGSNEGKLTGDFLAVISAHYIRNLREEVRKGIRGRLKQGLYPFKAYIGYLDQGGGKLKILDPQRAPFIRMAFELYSTGNFSLHALSDELYDRGLRGGTGKKVGLNRLAQILRNPFYMGIIHLKRTNENYAGKHECIVSKNLFCRVQDIVDGRLTKRQFVHDFRFRRTITCDHCRYRLVGETRKGHVYYRCQTRVCPTLSIREDRIDSVVREHLLHLALSKEEVADIKDRAIALGKNSQQYRDDQARAIDLQLENAGARLSRLMDVYLDGVVERPLFEEKKVAILMERKGLEQERARNSFSEQTLGDDVLQYLGLLESIPLSYESANPAEKRQLVEIVTSDLRAAGKNLYVKLKSPFREVEILNSISTGGPLRDGPRTKKIFELLVAHCKSHADERPDTPMAA
jgi:DNA invertase Pin-like site-specific DNA recombinase